MNRTYIIAFFLVLFLSCGTFSEGNSGKNFANAKAVAANVLTKEQKIISDKLDVFFTQMNQLGVFNGCVLVSKAGKILFQKSLGIANKEAKNKLTDSSMFQLASVSKVITATAVLMLHERKIVDIEKPFAFYFPDFPYSTVKVKDLLNHRSGLPNYMYTLNTEICKPNYQMNNLDMYNCFISKKAAPYMKPDTRFNYSNTNYALLALLIEKMSGRSYSKFLKEELFLPLGMRNTATIHEIDLNGANCTKPYDNRWRPVGFDASDYVLGDKSIYSTPYDLYLFSEALYQDRIIRKETQELAYTAFSKEKKLSNYGYGWRMKDFKDPDKKEVYHNGWWHGYRSSFHRRLKDTLTVVILSNQLNSFAYQTHKVYEILDNKGEQAYTADEE
jgi:CubicO group peptidase (beta-lactamase class C family)